MKRLPLIAPRPPRLSTMVEALTRVEQSGIYSNNGPELRAFEADATRRLFGGRGACLAVANATLGLMIALRDAVSDGPAGRFAIMPAMTFAATAQAAWWAGLTPLVCDIDAADWGSAAEEEERLLTRYGAQVAAVIPYATFGYGIDLDRYRWLSRRHGVAVVIDAAASLGTTDAQGVGFGAGAPFPVVFSMHATKPFATAEGGLIHCADADRIERLRAMANFGFTAPRTATLPGLNAKLPEAMAVVAQSRLNDFARVARHRDQLTQAYRAAIGDRYTMQPRQAGRQAFGFLPLLLPSEATYERDEIIARMDREGVGAGKYFSPHLGEQPWVRGIAQIEETPVADMVGSRLLSLPLSDTMTTDDVTRVVETLDRAVARPSRKTSREAPPPVAETLIVGGGPAGTAMLTAASRHGLLPDLSRGLVIVERDSAIGGGQLGRYAITSDSTAQTFLTAIEGNADPAIAALADHPAALAVARHRASLGVPLAEVGPLLRAIGDRLHATVTANGGEVLTGTEAVSARRHKGMWHVRLRDLATHREHERVARNLVIATGGHQPLDRLVEQQVAGASLVDLAGDRLLQSDSVLSRGGFEMVADLLAGKRAPKIAVIGGSTSALTTVALLLRGRPALPFGAAGITLLHRRPLRPFYHSVAAAHEEGFTDFGRDDICPVSGFVYRLAGFRLEARELVLRMLGVDGRAPDPRVALHRVIDDDTAARDTLANADLVIAALGYRPRALPLEQTDGTPLPLAAHSGAPMVDAECRICGADGEPVPNLYGIGLAAGFVPWGKLGGEASFVGQANGLWLWQNDVGMMIVDQLLAGRTKAAA